MQKMDFTVYPAIDLLGGRAVRLKQGHRADVTDCGDPIELAARWHALGAKWLHVVDLEAAFDGCSKQGEVIRKMTEAFQGPVQLGGGIRSMANVSERLESWGITRCILGTAAVAQPEMVEEACKLYPGKIACGIDAKDGMVAIRGWVDISNMTAFKLARIMEEAGVSAIIYTDISRDGMLSGPNLDATARLVDQVSIQVIASGGIAQISDLKALKQAGCAGAIVGKAFYSGAFSLDQALLV